MKDKNGMNHDEQNGQFTSGKSTVAEHKRASELIESKMTVAEKIASVHIKNGKENILPELNEEDLIKIGTNINKPVLVKASIVERNERQHPDVTIEETDRILGEVLYNSDIVFPGKNDKPYFSFVKSLRISPKGNKKSDYGVVLLDVSETKDNFEVVHWHWVGIDSLNSLTKRDK